MSKLSHDLSAAVAALRSGALIGVPTETVYGLAADASNPVAVARIFTAKGRPSDHPLIVHIPDATYLASWASQVPQVAYQLAEAFWPGPLTMILPKSELALDCVTGGHHTVGLRCPQHPVMQQLLQEFGGGLAAPSANRFGHISPTTAQAVIDEVGDSIDLVLDGGPTQVGIESTIVDLSGAVPVILRFGDIRPEDIEAVIGQPVEQVNQYATPASGTHARHYAPRSRATLLSYTEINAYCESHADEDIVVLAYEAMPTRLGVQVYELPAEPRAYARLLYHTLRQADALKPSVILIEAPPSDPAWFAVRDRLVRATHR